MQTLLSFPQPAQTVCADLDAEEAQTRAVAAALRSAFAQGVRGGVTAPAVFARRGVYVGWEMPERQATVADVMAQALERGDLMQRAMAVLAAAAAGHPVGEQAAQLLADAGQQWADYEAECL